ncbi:hypothetical protein QTP88_011655 [Uroleucon formosanum]
MSLSNNDEIRISVLNMDSYTLPCESYIYIEGKVNKPTDSAGDVRFSNNGLAFLFSEMRYEINGIEIQKLKSPGVSSCLKAYCSYTPNDLNALENSAWDSAMDSEDNKNFMSNNVFTGCIPLKHLFGFCEDYKKILLNCNQQLILNRASTDIDAIHVVGAGATAAIEKNKKITIELTKVLWKISIIKVSDKEKLRLLKIEKKISKSTLDGLITVKLKNLKVHLNSEVYPYEDFRADFKNNTTSILYKAYTDFQKSYYERDYSEPLLSKHIFQNYVPIVVVDLSCQNDNVKSSTVDLRIEFETDTVIPENTAAYCLILHDQIITYNPFSGDTDSIKLVVDSILRPKDEDTPRKKWLRQSIAMLSKENKNKSVIKVLKNKSLISEEQGMLLDSNFGKQRDLINNFCKKNAGRKVAKKYSLELRKFAVTLYFYSPKAYQFIRREFNSALPCPRTLSKWYTHVNTEPGFTKEALNTLELACKNTQTPIYSALMIDEISIRKHLDFNNDKYFGFVDFGSEIQSDYVDQATECLVFMVVAINFS